MDLIRYLLSRSRRNAVLAVLAGLASGLAVTVLLALVNHLLAMEGQVGWDLLVSYSLLCLLGLATAVMSHLCLVRLTQKAVYDLRLYLCEQMVAVPLREQERLGAGRLLACLTDDVQSIATVIVNLPYFVVNVIVVLGCLGYLGWLSPAMIGGLALMLSAGAASYLWPVRRAHRELAQARAAQDALLSHFRAITEGACELKLNCARAAAFLEEQLRATAQEVREANVRGISTYAIAANWNRFLFFIYVGLLIFAMPRVVQASPWLVASYVLVVLYLVGRIEAVMNTLPHLARAAVAFRKIRELGLALEQTAAATPNPKGRDAEAALIELALEDVTYRYGGEDDFHLGPISLALRPGEITFIVGGNGSGKTTFAKLLTGLYTPHGGQVRINGRAVTDADRHQHRERFSAVFAEFYLFDRLLGLDMPRRQALAQHYLEMLGLADKLHIENGNLSTTALSRGQRKRLALLAALLEERPAYLFDEWAADQDPAFKERFYTTILPMLREQGKLVVAITHDDRYLHLADRVVKLEEGALREEEAYVFP